MKGHLTTDFPKKSATVLSISNSLDKIPLIYCFTHTYVLGHLSASKIPLIYWMTLVYILCHFSGLKFPLIYWMILVYILGYFSVLKIPLISRMILVLVKDRCFVRDKHNKLKNKRSFYLLFIRMSLVLLSFFSNILAYPPLLLYFIDEF